MSLRTKIISLLGIITVLLLGLVVYYFQYPLKESFRREVESNLNDLAEVNLRTYRAFSEGLKIRTVDWSAGDQVVRFAEKILDKNTPLAKRNLAASEFAAYIREYKMPYDPDAIIVEILDSEGVVVASTREDRIGTDERQEEIENNVHHFAKTLHAGIGEAFMRGSVLEADETDRPMSHITTRLFSKRKDAQGNFIPLPGVFLVHFVSAASLLEFQQKKSDKNLATDSLNKSVTGLQGLDVYLVNGDRLIASAPNSGSAEMVGKPIATKPVSECFDRGTDTFGEYVNYRGVTVLGASRCLVEEGVLILNEMEVKKAYTFLTDLVRKTIFAGVALAAGFVFFVILVTRRPLKNLKLMVDVAEAVSKGDLTKRALAIGRDEIGYLARVFNAMLETISASQGKLMESEKKLEQEAEKLLKDLSEHKEQSKFVEQSKRATQNLLEDAWEIKEKLEVERNRLQTILASIGDALVLIDIQYSIVLVNPKAVEIFATPATDLLGKDLRVVMKLIKKKKGELSPAEWPIEEMFLAKHVIVADLEDELSLMTEKRTGPLPIALSAAPLVGEGGETTGGVIVIRDVTEDRELDEAKSGFISVASHQLRTPLTTIRWYSEMLLGDDVGNMTKEQREFLEEIHGGAERLYQTIDLLLGISRVESGKLKAEKKPIDLTLFTADLGKELAPQMIEKKLVFSMVPPLGEPVIVSLDPLTLRQVVLNLVSNAIRYTNENGTIEAKWAVDDKHTEVTYLVKDNGIGIPLAQRGRIFSKFFRAENALSKVPDGSGLGLALVKELVLAWGGKVWFEVEEGKGTTFFFTIPLVSSVEPLAEDAQRAKI
ncbi:MAG: ATP-binding protein [Patescibacteria group bacterium]